MIVPRPIRTTRTFQAICFPERFFGMSQKF
jgi:hypothetical protein